MAASDNNESPVPLVDLLGPKIILNNQDEISVAELSRTKNTIVLYFSAHWCPPCRGFTPILSKAYADYKISRSSGDGDGAEDDDGFELVFVSSDRNAEAFREYHSEMSFPALPYASRDTKDKLAENFRVNGIPRLVAIDSSTGEESSVNAVVGDLRFFVVQHGAAAFPLRPAHVQNMKDGAKIKQTDALQKLKVMPIKISVPPISSLSITGETAVTAAKKVTIELGKLLEQHEYVGLVFGDGDKGDATYEIIQEAAENIDSKKFIPVYVGWTEYGAQSDHSALWEPFCSIREDELTDDMRSALGDAAGSLDGLTMLTIKSSGSEFCGIDRKCEPSGAAVIASIDEGLRVLRQFGHAAFAWDEAAIKNAAQVKKCRVSDLKSRLTGFNFLRCQSAGNKSKSLLVRGTSNNEEDTEDPKKWKYISVDDLLPSNETDEHDSAVLGLYFSAYWCPPCRAFTPELLKEYEEVRSKEGANNFEVVFVSFDSDEGDFEKYYSSMVTSTKKEQKEQWLALDYTKSREFVSDLTEVFGVRGFPSLVLLKRDGTILSSNARGSVSKYGANSFPWDPESIQRAEEELLKKEEEDVDSQRKQGDGVVVRRIVGPVGSLKYDTSDRALEFKNAFSTAVLDETIVTQGVLFYEVEILALESGHHAQFGFALKDAFEKTNARSGSGVGDNGKSWGVCGFRKELWHDDQSILGDIVGFAVNVDACKIAMSKNGSWSKEVGCGVIFENHSLKEVVRNAGGIHPGLTGSGLKVRLNVQGKDLCFPKPPEEVWQTIGDGPSEKDNTK